MKTLYLSIIIISLILIGASNFSTAHIAIPQIFTSKSNFTEGDVIPINGYALPNSMTNIFLVNNHGNIQNSTQVKSNNTGYFNTSLGIPSHVMGGAWTLFAISGDSNFAMQLMVDFHGSNTPPFNSPSGFSPLKQFKLGIKPSYVQCRSDLQLIIKSEDGSPACVKSDTATTLIKRGWAMSNLQNFGYNPGRGPVSPEPKESGQFSSIGPNPFPPSTLNRLVFFIKSNSTVQIHVQYTSEFENTGNVDAGGQFYSGDPHYFTPLNSSQITLSSSPDHVSMSYGTNTTVVYTISTKNVTSGLYWISLTQICGVMPVAIGVNSSQITPSDIPVYSQHCPAQFLNAKILGISGGTAEYLQSQELQ